MPTPLTGIRTMRSSVFLSSAAATDAQLELDMRLGPQDGIEIYSFESLIADIESSDNFGASLVARPAIVRLHAQIAPLTDPPWHSSQLTVDDEVRLDTEIIYEQLIQFLGFEIAGGGGISTLVTPIEPIIPPTPILVPGNLTHRVQSVAVGGEQIGFRSTLRTKYRFVRFSDAELGMLLARRV